MNLFKGFEGVELKNSDDATGEVLAQVATFEVKDHDGDVAHKGSFGTQQVPLLVGHNWNLPPVGKGRIYEEGDHVYFNGVFNLSTDGGREAYESAKFLGHIQQWSYGYSLDPAGVKKRNGSRHFEPLPDGKASVIVHEVSTVVAGAGTETGTLMMKNNTTTNVTWQPPQDGKTAIEEAEDVLASITDLIDRAEDIQELRSKKNRTIGTEFLNRLAEVKHRIDELMTVLEPDETVDLKAEFLRYQKTLAKQHGVSL